MCQCYQIGGPFIAEDPDCSEHGAESKVRCSTAESLISDIDSADLFDLPPNSEIIKLLTDIRSFLCTIS